MSKVKITKEQEDAIEREVVSTEKEEVIRCHLKGWVFDENQCLNELTLDEVVRALYIGYEVEPDFKVGDWIIYEDEIGNSYTLKIIDIQYGNYRVQFDELSNWQSIERIFRYATPEEIAKEKERRWWVKHDRDVWEIKKDDSLIHDTEREYPDIIYEVGDFNIHFTDGHFYPKEYIKENYKVFCFAEDRKDV